jgi:SAM-dependent methyltransferase
MHGKPACISIDGDHHSTVSSDACAFYEKYWKPGTKVSEQSLERYTSVLKSLFPEGLMNKRILELGVGGEGGIIYYLKSDNIVFGLDASFAAQQNCRGLGLEIEIHNLDKDPLPFENDSLDVVFAFEVFEHFGSPQFVIEQIRRVLKPCGFCIITTPHTLIYHWPRIFYPELFSTAAFKSFLMINEFDICRTMEIGQHRLGRFHGPDERYWSQLWHCRKLCSKDAETYFTHGLYFWNQKDDCGIRTRAIEAIDCFRRSHQLAPERLEARLMLCRALLYRFVNGEQEEFKTHFNFLTDLMKTGDYPTNMLAQYHFAMLYVELEMMQSSAMSHQDFQFAIDMLGRQKGAGVYLAKIAEYQRKMSRTL